MKVSSAIMPSWSIIHNYTLVFFLLLHFYMDLTEVMIEGPS